MRRIFVLAVALLAFACADTREKVNLAFNDNGYVTITTISPLEDHWKHRFDHLDPSSERVTYELSHGVVSTVEHSAMVDVEYLQKFFSDVDITIRLTEKDGVSELLIFPATSSRATREERDEFQRRVQIAAQAFVKYVAASRHFYDYLDAHPQRAEYAFKQIDVETDDDIVAVSEEEKDLIAAVRHAIVDVAQTAPEKDAQQRFFALADRVNDPFPGVITIQLPHSYSSIEGFKRVDDRVVRAEVTSPLEALAALQGRWVSPDLLAMALGDDKFDPGSVAHEPRRAAVSLTADEVANAFIEQLKPKAIYRVRWLSIKEP